MLLRAVVIGVVGALATAAFRIGIERLESLLGNTPGSVALVEIARQLPWYLRLIAPIAGGFVAGALLVAARRSENRNGTEPAVDYMEAITIGDGCVPVRRSLWRSASSLVTIASGGSIGREGSMVQLASLCASLVGRVLHVGPKRLRLLVACGAAAGITSAYNAPIAGALFVTEIILGSIAMESFGPIVVSSVVANITMREFAGYHPPYEMPLFPAISGIEVLWFVVLGAVCGVAAPVFLRLISTSKQQFARFFTPLPLRLALGGAMVGVLSIRSPEVWGNGYEVVNAILHHPWTWQALLAVLLLKVLATCASVGSGAVGGIFTPTLFVGAVMGCLFGLLVHALPIAASAPFAYAIVGMGAFLAAATNAPLMAILMIFEITLSYQIMLPLMLSCVVAYTVARTTGEASMYEVTLRRRRQTHERLRLKALRMCELIRPADSVLPLHASVPEMAQIFRDCGVKYAYVVDDATCFQGVVALSDITFDLVDLKDVSHRTARDYMRINVSALTRDMPLETALKHFLVFGGERLPVIEAISVPVLLGVVHKTALLDAFYRLSGQDQL